MTKKDIYTAVIWLSLIIPLTILKAQTDPWVLVYGEEGSDRGYSIDATSDGGYIVGGRTTSWDAGVDDFYLLRLDSAGKVLWTRMYGGEIEDNAYCIRETSDQGFILAGASRSYGLGGSDVWLIKTDIAGDTQWTKTYGGANDDSAMCVIQVSDNGYLICGTTETFGGSGNDVYLVRTDSAGETQWSGSYGGGLGDEGAWVCQSEDGGFLVAGSTESFGAGDFDVYLIKIDAAGDTSWTRTYGGDSEDKSAAVEPTSDGGYIVAGSTWSFGAGWNDIYLLKLNSNGDTVWTRTFGGNIQDKGLSVCQTSDGGYVITGYTFSLGLRNNEDIILIKTDASGNTLWIRTFGGDRVDTGYQVLQTVDQGYIIAGRTRSYGSGRCDIYVLKTDPDGSMGASGSPPATLPVIIDSCPVIVKGSVDINYQLTKACNVKVEVYDPLGRKVSTIINSPQSPGSYQLNWNGCDRRGLKLSGVLFIRFETDYSSKVIRVITLR